MRHERQHSPPPSSRRHVRGIACGWMLLIPPLEFKRLLEFVWSSNEAVLATHGGHAFSPSVEGSAGLSLLFPDRNIRGLTVCLSGDYSRQLAGVNCFGRLASRLASTVCGVTSLILRRSDSNHHSNDLLPFDSFVKCDIVVFRGLSKLHRDKRKWWNHINVSMLQYGQGISGDSRR